MSVWYVASNLTPGDNSGLDMVPNPGDYTDLETDDNCLVMHNDQMMIYSYDETDAQAGNGISIVVPDGNATGTGRWIIKDISTQGQNGFPIPLGPDSDSDISFDDGTRTFTIEPAVDEFAFIVQGVKFIRDAADTVVIADTHGLHWIYYDETGTLQSAVFADLTEDNLILYNCLVSYLYWDATNNEALLVGDERHGSSMSPATHYHLHETYGSQYESGLQLSAFSVDGSGAAAASAQFDVTEGEIHDEDIEVSIPTEENATIDTFYKFGPGGPWFKFAASAGYPVADGSIGTRLDWNDQNGGDWQLVEVDSGKYVLTHYFATNNIGQPIIGIMGENTYNNAVAARAGAETELISLTTAGMPIIEYVAIATVIWQTNSSYSNQVAAIIRSTDTGDDYIDWRTTASLTGGGSSAVTHENLSGLLGGAALDHYHLTGAQHDTLTDGSDADALHDHDGISENTAARHAESHTITSHSDVVDATGAQLEELTGGGDTTLHDHDGISENTAARHAESHTITSHSDVVDATGAQLEELTGSGDTDLHDHNTVNHTDTEAIITVADDGFTVRDSGGNSPKIQLDNSAGTPYVRYRGDASGGYTDVWTGAAWESSVVNTIDGAVELYYNGNKVVESYINSTHRGIKLTDSDSQFGQVTKDSSGPLYVYNREVSGHVTLAGIDSGSAYSPILVGDPDDACVLYYNGLTTLATQAGGITVQDSDGDDPEVKFKDSSGNILSRVVSVGANLYLQSWNGAAWETAILCNLNGRVELNYNDIKAFQTDDTGISVYDTSGNNPYIHFKTDAGVQVGSILASSTSFYVRGRNHGGHVFIQGENTAGDTTTCIDADPDAQVTLNYAGIKALQTDATGISVYDTSGAISSIFFRDDADNVLSRMIAQATSTQLRLGAGDEVAINAVLNGRVDLYYNNIKEFETISGGAKATNSFQIAATTAVTGILDEDNMASDSSTALCTQQSIKAYADSVGGGGGGGGVGHNVIINGDMSVNQRAASYAAPTTGDYTLDRWSVSFSGDTIVSTITQDTDVPTFAQADHKSEYSLKIDCTTAEAAVAAGDYYYLTYAVEGNDISPYMGDEITLSYWIKSTKIGVYGVSFQNSATDRSYIVEHEILVTDTWEKKTETFTLTDSGTWLADEGVGMYVNFAMFAGSTAHGTADTWNATADTSTANQVNLLDNTANDVIISQVKLETGAAATQFVSRPQAEELALCQRYYEKSYSQGTYLGTTTTVGQVLEVATRNSGAITYGQRFNHTKCKVPTMVLYSPVTGASGKIGNSGDKTGVATNVGDSGWAHCSITSGTTGAAANYHWSADAEL